MTKAMATAATMDAAQENAYGDPLTRPFWAGARRGELLLQFCRECERWQFYPRPFCLRCYADHPEWRPAAGTGVVYSATEVHLRVSEEHEPPYTVAVIELDEGPRLTANLVDPVAGIGQRVAVQWRPRPGGPPVPVFALAG